PSPRTSAPGAGRAGRAYRPGSVSRPGPLRLEYRAGRDVGGPAVALLTATWAWAEGPAPTPSVFPPVSTPAFATTGTGPIDDLAADDGEDRLDGRDLPVGSAPPAARKRTASRSTSLTSSAST